MFVVVVVFVCRRSFEDVIADERSSSPNKKYLSTHSTPTKWPPARRTVMLFFAHKMDWMEHLSEIHGTLNGSSRSWKTKILSIDHSVTKFFQQLLCCIANHSASFQYNIPIQQNAPTTSSSSNNEEKSIASGTQSEWSGLDASCLDRIWQTRDVFCSYECIGGASTKSRALLWENL